MHVAHERAASAHAGSSDTSLHRPANHGGEAITPRRGGRDPYQATLVRYRHPHHSGTGGGPRVSSTRGHTGTTRTWHRHRHGAQRGARREPSTRAPRLELQTAHQATPPRTARGGSSRNAEQRRLHRSDLGPRGRTHRSRRTQRLRRTAAIRLHDPTTFIPVGGSRRPRSARQGSRTSRGHRHCVRHKLPHDQDDATARSHCSPQRARLYTDRQCHRSPNLY